MDVTQGPGHMPAEAAALVVPGEERSQAVVGRIESTLTIPEDTKPGVKRTWEVMEANYHGQSGVRVRTFPGVSGVNLSWVRLPVMHNTVHGIVLRQR